jgi:hypothetical protein
MLVSGGPAVERKPCRHDSTRRDGTLDNTCLLCGVAGYWHEGHRHDEVHPSGKVMLRLGCPDTTRTMFTAGDESVSRPGTGATI